MRGIYKAALLSALGIVCCASAALAAPITLDFDDLPVGQEVPAGYMGITFDLGRLGFDGHTGRAVVADASLGGRPGTPPNCIINEWGVRQLDFTSSSGLFNFYGAVVARYGLLPSQQAPLIGFVGFRKGKTVALSPTYTLSDTPGWAAAGFVDVDMVEIVSANGQTGDAGWYSLDHLIYEPVPEPGSLLALTGALIGAAGIRKRPVRV